MPALDHGAQGILRSLEIELGGQRGAQRLALPIQMGNVEAAVRTATRQKNPTVKMNCRSNVESKSAGEESATMEPIYTSNVSIGKCMNGCHRLTSTATMRFSVRMRALKVMPTTWTSRCSKAARSA